MILEDVLLLTAPTSRSQAYLQTLVAHDMLPAHVLLMGDPSSTSSLTPRTSKPAVGDLLLPRLDEPLLQTCTESGLSYEVCNVRSVNDEKVANIIRSIQPRMVIYSGFGGQIVGETILSLGSRFLHMHSGHIPAYRGSTTLYYALLNGDCPTVTALFLDPCIDTGPIVARRTYAKPPAGVDIDHQYDSAIRADLLLRVLRTRLLAGGMLEAVPQPSVEDAPYYVIHPVLKHLAVLSLETQPDHA